MELTTKNIEQLYKFTKDHFVDWYDLQTELVDHLANDIEEIWKKNPSISFETARDISFKKFGIFGFGDIVEQKQNALSKHYWKEVLKEFVQFFRLPKIILTVFFCIGTYSLFSYFNNGYFIFSLIFLTTAIYPIFRLYKHGWRVKRRNKSNNKSWQLDGIIYQTAFFPYIVLCPYSTIVDLFFKPSFTPNQLIFFSVSLVLFSLLFYVSTEIVSPNMQKKMVKLFPDYAIV
tara:strand:- start:6603 stop:7295 length:693 start_codon:yes stop_codon:yes gene_type:complete